MTDDAKESLAIRHDRYRATLGQRRQLIAERWMELRMMRWSRAGVDQLRSWVRDLAEQSTEFGYVALGEMARELQHRIDAVIGDYPPFKEMLGGVTAAVERMNLQVDRVQLMSPSERPTASAGAAAAASKAKVLLADSDAESSALIGQVLKHMGLTFETVSAAEALDQRLHKGDAELLIIDESVLLQLPNALQPVDDNGVGRFADTPWILLSRYPDIDLRMRALQAGASACLSKPLDLQELAFALPLSSLPLLNAALTVQIVADTPELAERHAETLKEAGMVPLLGAELAHLPDVVAAEAAHVMLLDMNFDIRERDRWLDLLADTPGFDGLPVVCLNVQRATPQCRHRRVDFLSAPAPKKLLLQALRRAVLENDRDTLRVQRRAHRQTQPRLCTPDVFLARLAQTISSAASDESPAALLLVEFDQVLALLQEPDAGALVREQSQLERALLAVLEDTDCCTNHGSVGLLALLSGSDSKRNAAVLAQLRQATASLAASSAVLLPLRNVRSASEALQRADLALREARKAGGQRDLQLETAAPPKPAVAEVSPLPVQSMRLQVHPLTDVAGNPQPLHDATIHVIDRQGVEQPLATLLAEVVAKGLATHLDVWEMQAAADFLCGLSESTRGVEVSMRLSTASRESESLVPVVREIVARLPANRGFRLVFEVAESWLVDHNAAAVEMVEALRSLGCGVMLGDFGGTDNPRNLAWASWFDYARLSYRRLDHITATDERHTAIEKLVRTACSRGARVIAPAGGGAQARAGLAAWGVGLFE